LLIALIATGLVRRRLKRRFRPVHAALAFLLALAVIGRAAGLYARAGMPRSVWRLCGSAALLVAAVGAAAGLMRRRLKRRFLRVHVTLAFTALILAVLHRLLA